MAYKPLSQDYLQNGLNQYVGSSQQPVVEEKGWGERIKDDIVNTVGNYFTGAQQGINEMARAQDAQMGDPLGQMYSGGGYQPASDETNQWVNDAQKTFANETALPALAFNPATALPAITNMIGGHAIDTYQETEGTPLQKAGNAVRAVTYGPAVDMYNNPNLAQDFQERPVSTLASGAMAIGQAILPFAVARRGAQKVGELKNDLVSHVENKLNEITDNPPLQNTGIQGLDALDQFDSPTRGFRPATPEEFTQYNIEQKQQAVQPLTSILDRIKTAKFDEANNKSYDNYMSRKVYEDANLDLFKDSVRNKDFYTAYEIADKMGNRNLANTLLEADRNIKSDPNSPMINKAISDSIKFYSENQFNKSNEFIEPSNVTMPNPVEAKRVNFSPQYEYELGNERTKLYDTFINSGIDETTAKTLSDNIVNDRRTTVRYNDDVTGYQKPEYLQPTLKRAWEDHNTNGNNYALASVDFANLGGLNQHVNNISDVANTHFRSVTDIIKQSVEDSGIKNAQFIRSGGDEFQILAPGVNKITLDNAMENARIKVSQYAQANGLDSIVHPKTKQNSGIGIHYGVEDMSNVNSIKGLKENAEMVLSLSKQSLKDGAENVRRSETSTSRSLPLERQPAGIAERIREENASKPKTTRTTTNQQQVESPIKGGSSDLVSRVEKKLNSGIDPTGGRFDNVDLGLQARQAANKIKDRIVNTTENDRIIDNNSSRKLPEVKKVMQRAYQQVFDSLDPITRYDREVYKSARLANGSAIGKAESTIKNKNNPMSFENITKPVHNRIDDFAEYMVAVRAKELHATGTVTGVSNKKIAEIISKAPAEFAAVQKQLTKYSDNLLQTLVDSGMISKEHAQNMRNKYESYAPMMRAFDVEEISRMFRDKGDLGKPIQNIEGSTTKVVNPIESILKNTYTFNMIAETNKVRQQIASLAEAFPDEIKILKNGEAAEKGTGTFDFFVDGKKHTMQLEPRLFEAIASMDSQSAGIVVTVLSKPASWLRAGATLSPEFMAKNLIRDTIGASIVGKGFTPFVDSIRGLKSAWNKDADYWRYKEEGGALGHLTGLDRNHMQEMLDNYRSKSKIQKATTVFNPKTWLDILRKGQELSEDATRIGYYKKRLSKGDSPHEAAFEARDLLDFGRSGNYTREANKVAAFLNASLQGTDKLVRSFKERPLETAANTMKYLILPSMAAWYLQSKSDQKDQIKELPRYVKDMFWIIPAGDKLIRIPKPFEAGVLFATGTERAMEAAFGESKTPFKGYGESLLDVTIPNLLPTGLIPLGEWWANKSLFTGQPIVPMKEQNLPDNLQYGAYTTNVARFLGDNTGQSPRKIDNTIRSLTGGAGTAVTSAIDKLTGGNGTVLPTQTASDMPVVKAFIADPRKSQQSTNDFYDELDKHTKKYQAESIRKVKMTPTEKKNYQSLNNANTALKALNKEERKIIESTTLSPDAKRAKLDKIIDLQTKLVQTALKKIK